MRADFGPEEAERLATSILGHLGKYLETCIAPGRLVVQDMGKNSQEAHALALAGSTELVPDFGARQLGDSGAATTCTFCQRKGSSGEVRSSAAAVVVTSIGIGSGAGHKGLDGRESTNAKALGDGGMCIGINRTKANAFALGGGSSLCPFGGQVLAMSAPLQRKGRRGREQGEKEVDEKEVDKKEVEVDEEEEGNGGACDKYGRKSG